ncbi:MAG: sigma-70 family RNA polymerase sigma factor [Planctomycetota bacterium]
MVEPETIPAAVRAVLAGDDARFGEIVVAFDAPVRRIVTRRLRDPHAREDVIQEIWIRVYRQVAALLDVRSADAWIGRIARNCVSDHHRTRGRAEREAPLAEDVPDGRPATWEPASWVWEPASWVWETVDALPDGARDVLTWRYRHGLSYADIGARLDAPVSTVRGRLYEARLALRRRLEEREAR